MSKTTLAAICLAFMVAGCASGPGDRALVTGAGEEMLKLRYGPSLNYKVKMGLPDGTALIRHDCVTELGQRWCRVSLAEGPGVTGYVSADYLTSP
ncbi:MAG: SH3 domain-containing protein [Roseovarius sp.]